jgi:hypothetical protein
MIARNLHVLGTKVRNEERQKKIEKQETLDKAA